MPLSIFHKIRMPAADQALPGRTTELPVPPAHFVLDSPLRGPYPEGSEKFLAGLGCFWGAEKKFWEMPVITTAVGYSGGITPNPLYEEVCSGMTGHNEVVLVVFDPRETSYRELLKTFWESHDPTQGMRQGNDIGTQYRSGIYTFDDEQAALARQSLSDYQNRLTEAGFGRITTEILPAGDFFYAEHYHQQYLAKIPNGYCGLGGTGVSCQVEPLVAAN